MVRSEPIVVTGLSIICALGEDTTTVWQAVREGRCGIREIRNVDVTQLGFRLGGRLPTSTPIAT
ncbi:MAG: beta-ketoacyl synthase N-terminal-like domain-containing protein [Bacillota bacterium]|nr:MAG: hypothetical protein DIU70_01830 [Bacillota bacterium]